MTSFTTFSRALACAALGIASLAQAADNKQPDPADANAAVPPTRYVAVPKSQPQAAAATPDQNWKALNQTVGSLNSMMLTMGAPEPTQPQQPAQPEQPAPTGHQHHHEGMKQ